MDKLYTIIEVATKLGISDKTLRRWEEAGRFKPSRTLGNQRRYTLEDLQILDAIKHGTINSYSDLLTITQAAQISGVSPTTILRWENLGKIHPFITSLNTYYLRTKLIEKMEELKNSSPEPLASPLESESESPLPPPSHQDNQVQPLVKPKLSQRLNNSIFPQPIPPILTNTLVTLLLILSYHFLFNTSSTPTPLQTPTQGSVQGVTASDPRLDLLEEKLQDHLASEMLKDARPLPVTTINLDNTSLYTGKLTLLKGQDQVTYTNDQITLDTLVNANFTSDYSPAKKYWITANQGSFTLTTDFPVSQDSHIHYHFLTPNSSQSASASSSASLR